MSRRIDTHLRNKSIYGRMMYTARERVLFTTTLPTPIPNTNFHDNRVNSSSDRDKSPLRREREREDGVSDGPT